MRIWESNIRKVVPYVPGEQPDKENMIKLNTNENPYPPAPGVRKIMDEFKEDTLRLYPDPCAGMLVKEIANYYKLKPEQVFVGVGSDDVLAMAFMTFFQSKKPILFPEITYSFYDVWAELFNIPYVRCSLADDFSFVIDDYKRENGGIIFPNPNAPTGLCERLETIEKIIKYNQDVIVIVDEAYIDFGGESALSLLDKYENLLVVQTFSKSRSMAGVRIGFAMGSPTLIKYLNDVKYSFNSYTLNRFSLEIGVEAIRDEVYFKSVNEKIISTRERVKNELLQLGFTFPDSKTNFVFATHEKYNAKDIFLALKENNIYVRYFDKPKIHNYLRITIGTDEEMDALLDFLKHYIGK
ncbi:histidinol-phosphate transaminase [Anaerosacchariphilus polymeriproducens]|uniref:Histidinol-phosphate aminotransferase n=1 Tax=Anaerosacchariphilus polymeriproducens TaxID=1812858 RepID=A0A371AWM0_9FIRM|nr:histidinol-phosphate transaminase [Anaerosacchariphilus polymeriproducens]RDU23953.1 histidinol-phosphate transaminase [Anaerosacchariphilus polymeriproducens]